MFGVEEIKDDCRDALPVLWERIALVTVLDFTSQYLCRPQPPGKIYYTRLLSHYMSDHYTSKSAGLNSCKKRIPT